MALGIGAGNNDTASTANTEQELDGYVSGTVLRPKYQKIQCQIKIPSFGAGVELSDRGSVQPVQSSIFNPSTNTEMPCF